MPALRDSGLGPEAEHPEYAGQYRLEARLGAGGMGVVHLARSSSGLTLAVKVVHAEFAQDPEFRGRFRQEVAAARRVSGAFTAPVVDADPDAERPWMATLHIPGPSLSDHVKRNGPMVPGQVRQLAAGLAEALRDIHRAGVVHRDLKPGNVLLAADGPKVIDFGISRPSDSEMRTETGKLIGTPPFMAPEQFQRPREVGPAADVFALGSVLVHAATGRGPFDSESPYLVAYQVVHDEADLAGVPEELAPLIESCLAKDPADRPTPDALMELLRTAAAEDGARPAAESVGAQLPGEASGSAPPDAPIPGQPQPVRSSATPPRAETTHVRAPVPPDPVARRPARTALLRARRWPLWAALALVVTGAGTFAGIRALAPAGDGQDPALQVHPSHADQAHFRPWHTTLTKRPKGYAAELPFCTTGSGAVFCGRAGTLAARLDPGTGQVAWRRKDDATTGKNSLKTTASPTPPALSGGLLYVFSADAKRLMALDPSADGKGATRWSKDVSGYEGGARIVGDQVLLTAADGTVTALDSATHRQLWHKHFPGHALPAFTAFGDPHTAYAAENTPDGTGTQVTAINPAHGSVRWSRRLPGLLTVAGPGTSGALYLTVTDPTFTYRATAVLRYDPATGHTRRLKLTAPLDGASAVVHGESVYLLAEGGALQAVGERTWDTETSVSRGSAPVVSGGRLYFTAADGRLLAIDTRSGELLGQTPPRMNGRHNGYVESLPAPLVDGRRGRIYAAAPDGSVFSAAAGDPAGW
ncbi:PQQ-binding-like beta-propeller repeat protein [Streptomyces sioyaensis]|uniref:Serine/threonine protein kinase n=1 Tax=Streptomyces sioyaensis TaxID=67364 RepID=A0A4V1NPS3_9ACTN|nr:PQQ-binding-like beta-propeller repeat protein [Streptomyces sioyaensis]MBM4794258.1 PQQ-binding-like beta-propeller repeat protein [Streptomyces sioyaensis]RXS65820.1 serine/threonine protein kinase [Streptomyces sioyaensis]